jgi:AraC-like DNA-binding protein
MSRIGANHPSAKYYKFSFCDGMEALYLHNHKTPFPSHFHPTFNITLVYDGVFNTKLHDRLVIAPSGTILITNPQEIHANPREDDSSVSFFTFYVSQEFLEYCNDGNPVFFENKTIDDMALFADLHQLSIKLINNSDPASIENDFKITLASLAAKHGSNSSETPYRIQLLFDQLLAEDHFEKFSLAEAAKRFGIDKYKFIRLFKYQTGLTPNNYFIYKRIEKSKAMLSEGKDLLSVAIDLGFYDTAHFCNYFKKFTGISPTTYTTSG